MTRLQSFLALSVWILLGFAAPNASPSSLLLTEGKPSNDLGQQDDYALEPNHKLIYHKTSTGWDDGTSLGGGGMVDGQQLFDSSHVLSLDAGVRKLYGSNGTSALLDWSNLVHFKAIDSSAHTSIDFSQRKLNANDGSTVQIDYSTAAKGPVISRITANSSGGILADNSSANSVDWKKRQLHVTDNFGLTNLVGDYAIMDWHLASYVGFYQNSSGRASTAIYYNGLFQVGMVGPPGTVTVAEGTPGTTHYQYGVTAVDLLGNETDIQQDDFNSGNAVLDSTNKNLVSWTISPGAASYNVYRSQSAGTPSSVGKIGNTTSTSFEDTGLAGDGTTGPTKSGTGYIVDTEGSPGSPVIAVGKRQGIYGTGGIFGSQTVMFDWSDPTRFKFFDGTSYVKSNGVYHAAAFTVAALPTGAQGDLAYVTDALTPTYGATVVGGGAVVTPVFFDGTNWTAH